MAKTKNQDMWKMLTELEWNLADFFGKKAPQLPTNVKQFIVKIVPYLTILGVILSVPAIFALLGLSAMFAPLVALGGGWTLIGIVSLLALIVTVILEIMAIPGLFKKKKNAWDKLFWVSLVGVVSSLVGGNWFGLLIGTAINWYFLFQIRPYYK